VFAVPGEITSALSRGTNHLLRLGAAPVLEPADVIAVLGLEQPEARRRKRLSDQAEQIRELVSSHPASIDELVRSSGLSANAVATSLVELELAGEAVCAEGTYRAQGR
jgi:DNA processing protein